MALSEATPALREPHRGREPWVGRWRRLWTIATPVILFTFAQAFHGTDRWNVAGVIFIVAGQVMRAWAAGCIHKDTELTMSGPYALTRNPLYFGSFLIGIGYGFLSGLWQALVLIPILFAAVHLPVISYEESELKSLFGSKLDEYFRSVPRFFPRPRLKSIRQFSWQQFLRNREWEAAAANAICMTLFLVW